MDRRNLEGYFSSSPVVRWPSDARVAVSFVVNVEEGAELSIGDGDERNEQIYEVVEEVQGVPDLCMESHFGYGPRAGYARIVNMLDAFGVVATFSTCGRAAARMPWLIRDALTRKHEISCHGWRWERHAGMDEQKERGIIRQTHETISKLVGKCPVGWHTRSACTPMTRRLLVEHGGFLYDSDAYDDDVPYVVKVAEHNHVVLPYAFDTNDMRFSPGGPFLHGEDFARYCLSAYDRLELEGRAQPRMMSVGLHLRIIGRPARISGLEALLQGICERRSAWIATRADIARHWRSALGLPEWRSASR